MRTNIVGPTLLPAFNSCPCSQQRIVVTTHKGSTDKQISKQINPIQKDKAYHRKISAPPAGSPSPSRRARTGTTASTVTMTDIQPNDVCTKDPVNNLHQLLKRNRNTLYPPQHVLHGKIFVLLLHLEQLVEVFSTVLASKPKGHGTLRRVLAKYAPAPKLHILQTSTCIINARASSRSQLYGLLRTCLRHRSLV